MIYVFLILLIAAADLCIKHRVKKSVGSGTKDIIPDMLQFSVVKNSGAAYSLLSSKPNAVRWLSGSGILLLTIYFIRSLSSVSKSADSLALSLILGGALGNFADRIKNGNVTDFIRLKWKKAPVFNVADMCILIGAAVLLVSDLTKQRK